MPNVPDPNRFVQALILYFGDDSSPGFSPTACLDGNARVRAEFPEHADVDRLAADPWMTNGLLITRQISAWQLRLGSLKAQGE